jgi:hypothetical protein
MQKFFALFLVTAITWKRTVNFSEHQYYASINGFCYVQIINNYIISSDYGHCVHNT